MASPTHFTSTLMPTLIILLSLSTHIHAAEPKFRISTISAAPSVLPYPSSSAPLPSSSTSSAPLPSSSTSSAPPPSSSTPSASPSTSSASPPSSSTTSDPPALSPDVSPLFPTPAGSNSTTPSPSAESSDLPLIPSNPSPPIPDAIGSSSPNEQQQPEVGSISPTGSVLQESDSMGLCPSGFWLVVLFVSVLQMGEVGFW